MGTEHVRWLAEPELTNPVMILGFTGWNDAGDAASTSVRTMIESWGASAVAEIDPEIFTDFATVRPHVRLDAERNRSIVWPTVGVWSASLPGADALLVLGPEPALRWRLFCEQIVGVAERFSASMALTLGALLADVAHNRPVQLIGSASDEAMIQRFDLVRSRYEGPTGIVGVLHAAFADAGVSSASLWAAVPGYASQVPSPKAAMALVERACSMIGTPAPLSALADATATYEAQVDSAVDDDLAEYLEQLDDDDDDDLLSDASDTSSRAATSASETTGNDGDVDSDALLEEVEKFLRDQD